MTSEDARQLTAAMIELIRELRELRNDLQQWSQPTVVSGGFTVCSHRFVTSEYGTVRCANCGLDLGSTDAAQTGGAYD